MGLTTLAVLLLLPRFTRTIHAVLVAVIGATVVTQPAAATMSRLSDTTAKTDRAQLER